MTRVKPRPAATSRSQSVLFPDPAGPAMTRRIGADGIGGTSVAQRDPAEQEAIGGQEAADAARSSRPRKKPIEEIPQAIGLRAEPEGEGDAEVDDADHAEPLRAVV